MGHDRQGKKEMDDIRKLMADMRRRKSIYSK